MTDFNAFFHFTLSDNKEDEQVRRHLARYPAHSGETQAGVLVLFIGKDKQKHLVLTRRSARLANHAGQISFVGGKREKGDANLMNTALREAHEEIGLLPENTTVYGCLPDLPTLTGYRITPVLAETTYSTWQKNEEVSEIFTLPADIALDCRQYQTEIRQHQQQRLFTLKLPYLNYDIWGATATILYRLAFSYQRFCESTS